MKAQEGSPEEDENGDKEELIEKLRGFFLMMIDRDMRERELLSCPHTDFLEGAD